MKVLVLGTTRHIGKVIGKGRQGRHKQKSYALRTDQGLGTARV